MFSGLEKKIRLQFPLIADDQECCRNLFVVRQNIRWFSCARGLKLTVRYMVDARFVERINVTETWSSMGTSRALGSSNVV